MAFGMGFFRTDEIVSDATGEEFIKKEGVSRFLGCTMPVLYRTHIKKNGLAPLLRRVNGFVVFKPEDVKNYAELRRLSPLGSNRSAVLLPFQYPFCPAGALP
jgi:hypothetical protein